MLGQRRRPRRIALRIGRAQAVYVDADRSEDR
jgi:hypothetical protein